MVILVAEKLEVVQLPVESVIPKADLRAPSLDDLEEVIIIEKPAIHDEASHKAGSRGKAAVEEKAVECYKIAELTGKGTGVIAQRKIFPGEVIMSEEPWLVIPDEIFEDTEKTEKFLDRKINCMSSGKIEQFLSLTDCRNPEDPTYLGIFYTNDMNYCGDAALFPNMARVNHSCRANSEFISRPDLGVQRLVAMYPIEEGEEITINYMPMSDEGSDVRPVRQNYLLTWYGFRCTCTACTLQDGELEKDDEVREEIKELLAVGLDNLGPSELSLLYHRLFDINGKLSFMLDILDQIYRKTSCTVDRYLVGVRGLSLAILVHGEDSAVAMDWRHRAFPDQLKIAEFGALIG